MKYRSRRARHLKMMPRCRVMGLTLMFVGVILMAVGCSGKEIPQRTYENMTDITYEIVSGSDVPHKVNEKIFKEKEKGFGFTYRDGEAMYIAFGFGRQNTGGFSIQMAAAKENESEILIEAKLVAPGPEEVVSTSPSHPYMILKMANVEKDVQFILH